ncbi:hypothetical protein Syun_017582 [Stephania yunnanensis]|uniref:GIY-YIG domain-containing protein n=1 Tax=Stephania yunnanensis TaxID=152371 RepID=A0AAP0P589_9MAGN
MTRLLSQSFRSVKPHQTNLCRAASESQTGSSSSTRSSWSVYLILSTNKPIKTYVGVTNDFSRRFRHMVKISYCPFFLMSSLHIEDPYLETAVDAYFNQIETEQHS